MNDESHYFNKKIPSNCFRIFLASPEYSSANHNEMERKSGEAFCSGF